MPLGFRKKTIITADEANAYSQSDDTWDEGREALSSSIQQHTANLKGEDDLELTDDMPMTVLPPIQPTIQPEPIPKPKPKRKGLVGIMRSKTRYSKRKTAAAAAVPIPPASTTPAAAAVEPPKNPTAAAPDSATTTTTITRSSPLIPAPQESSSSSEGKTPTAAKPLHTTAHTTKRSTRIRAMIALICLIVSILLAFGHGTSGLWITHHTIKAGGGGLSSSSPTEEAPIATGVPGPIGRATAYNGTFDIPDLQAMNILLSPQMENLADWKIPFPASNRTDLPFFWSVPKSGGTVVQRILGQCLGLVEASSKGAGHNEPGLQIFETSTGTRYINIDPTTLEGLERAKNLGLAGSGLADALFSPFVLEVSRIFNPLYRGRMFTVLRDPIERAMSLHHSALQENPNLADMPLAEFATNYLPNNEMVRMLINKNAIQDLDDDDLYLAMEILRRKCVVGLVDRMEESLIRFHGYFGWYSLMVEGVANCQAELLAPAQEHLPVPMRDSEAWVVMTGQNRLDLRLYEYAQFLFDVQGGTTRVTK